jgi:hypothetical protein
MVLQLYFLLIFSVFLVKNIKIGHKKPDRVEKFVFFADFMYIIMILFGRNRVYM